MEGFFYSIFTDTIFLIKYYGYESFHQGGQHCLHDNQSTLMLSRPIMRRVGMKIRLLFIALFVGLFWAGIAALTLPLITLPVFLITCTVTFIAVGLCLAGSETTGFDRGQV